MIMRHIPFLATALFTLQACTSIDVKTDFDPSADFSKFHTFAFAGGTDINKGGILDNSLMRKRMESIVGRELESKGLQQVGVDHNPDLLVHYWVGVAEKQQIQSYGPAGPRAYRWGGGYGGVTTYNYEEGTLVVDLVEARKKELAWRATMVADLADSTQDNMELVNKAITKAFKDYPPTKSAP
jgi:CubicO group peptidase (beta-lactamase class C family)